MTQRATTSKHTLGSRLKEARTDADLSITKLARELNVDPRTVARWQADKVTPSIERLGEIARVLGKPISFFLVEVEL